LRSWRSRAGQAVGSAANHTSQDAPWGNDPPPLSCLHLFFFFDADAYPTCEIAVVGGGIGGLYAAYRLATSPSRDARRICVFEASETRLGGRIFRVRFNESLIDHLPSIPELEGLDRPVEAGAYRFVPTQVQLAYQIREVFFFSLLSVSRDTPAQ
jgi:hypothetical protein